MAVVNTLTLSALTVLGIAGAFVAVGGVASLTDLQGATPYRFAWYLGAFALFAYIVTIISLFVGFRRLRIAVVALLTVNTGILSGKLDEFWKFKDEANPTGRAGDSVNAVLAGILVVLVANLLLILAYGFSEFEDSSVERLNASGSDLDRKNSAV